MNKLLIIDDKYEIRLSLKAILEDAGYEIDEATNGREALNKIEDKSYSTDFIITDIMMPELDGIEFMSALKAINKNIPVLAISGGGHTMDANIMLKAVDLVANHVLTKPFTPDELIQAIHSAQNNKKAES